MGKNDTIDQLLMSYDEQVQLLAEATRQLIISVLPGINEEADLPAKLLAYGFGPGYKHTICTIILSKKGVKLGLYKGAELPDPQKLLEGSGKVHKYIAISNEKDIKNPAVKTLLKEADKAYRKRVNSEK
jgi:hypothetical protein